MERFLIKTAAHFQGNGDDCKAVTVSRLTVGSKHVWTSSITCCTVDPLILNNITFTGIVHPQIKVLPPFTHRHVDLNLYAGISSVKHIHCTNILMLLA